MEYKEEKIIEERKRKVKDFLLNKKFLIILIGLIILLILAWYTRTLNIPNLKDITTEDYTLGPDLDPYLFLRYAEYIEKNGNLMKIDYMRNVPLGFDTSVESKFLVYMIVYFHKIFSIFSGKEMVYSAVMFPVFMFLLTIIAFYLFIDKVFENKKYGNIIKMLFIEFFVMFIEVMFFYREFVSSLAPFLSQMTNEQFQMNVYHILIIATMSWVGVRAGVWFFFAKFGTPTLLMIISREGLLEKAENGKIKVVGGPLLWIKEIVDELQGEINWFSDKGREITEAFVLPPVQIFACMTNFVMIVLTGRILFSLPLHTLKEIKDTKQLLDQIAKEEKK